MSERKSFVMSFDYDESLDSAGAAFGIAHPFQEITAIGELFIKAPVTDKGTSITAFLVNGIESGAISGGMLMLLATAGIKQTTEITLLKTMADMMKKLRENG